MSIQYKVFIWHHYSIFISFHQSRQWQCLLLAMHTAPRHKGPALIRAKEDTKSPTHTSSRANARTPSRHNLEHPSFALPTSPSTLPKHSTSAHSHRSSSRQVHCYRLHATRQPPWRRERRRRVLEQSHCAWRRSSVRVCRLFQPSNLQLCPRLRITPASRGICREEGQTGSGAE